jgi:hypothetical protein
MHVRSIHDQANGDDVRKEPAGLPIPPDMSAVAAFGSPTLGRHAWRLPLLEPLLTLLR